MCAINLADMPEAPMLVGHLESFIEIARHGNVSRAADALFLTQPAVTARLKSLETDLGVALFARTPRGMKLTDAGRAYLPYAERALAVVAEGLILFDRTSSYHELTSALFRQAGVVPASVMELDNVEAAKKMVQQGLGVALLPRMALSSELRSRSLRPVRLLGAPSIRRPIVALRRRDAGEPVGAVADFLAMLKELRTA